MNQNKAPEIAHDPTSVQETLAADSLRDRINHPFSDVKVFHTHEPQPVHPLMRPERGHFAQHPLSRAQKFERARRLAK